MIPDDVVDQVREAADIVQIVGEYVPLKKTGADYRGPCPFHQGTHRNFSVSPSKKIYYCFVCGEGGDVFRFLQKRMGIDWPSAVKLVGEKSGVEVREVDTRAQGPDPREPLWEVNATAADYFARMLWNDAAGAPARTYLESRGISREIAEKAELGFAPSEIGVMRAYMMGLGFNDARLLEVGLLVQKEEQTEPRPRFRGRLMFPIVDAGGRHVGFGGRVLGAGEPKYLNSPDSPAYSKGRLLYGLHWARNEIRRDDRALVVEGYFDVIGLIAAGITTAVAPLGTALTPDQAAMLRRYSRNVYLLYDSDRAGLVATFRAGDELLRQGMSVRVVTFPEGEDPDSFARKNGREALEAQLAQSVDVFERKIQLLQRSGAFSELHRKRRALDRLLPTLRAASDPLTRDLYVARTAEVAGVAREVLLREISAAPSRRAGSSPEPQLREWRPDDGDPAGGTTADRPAPRVRVGDATERELVRALLSRPERLDVVAEKVDPRMLRDSRYRRIYERLLETDGEADIEVLSQELDEEQTAVLQSLMSDPDAVVDAARAIEDSIKALRARSIDRRLREIDDVLGLADDAQKTALTVEKSQLTRELALLGKRRYKAFQKKGAI